MIRFYLGQEPILHNVPTHICSEPDSLKYVLDNIEKLILSILAVIPSGYTVGSVSNPIPMTIGASEILMSEIELSTQYTQTN
jgi:uncharacterized circularly permuted ATP-grasp superfamily protein